MKKITYGLLVCVLILITSSISFAQFNIPTWPDNVNPAVDPIIILWVLTDRYHYATNEIFSPQVSVSDPLGLTGQICIIQGIDSQDKICKFVSEYTEKAEYVEKAKGVQFSFSFIERKTGVYHYQAFMISKRGTVASNTIEIVISKPPAGENPKAQDVKYESLTEDDNPNNILWFVRCWGDYNEDGLLEWSQPFMLRGQPPAKLAPRVAKRTNVIVWGSLKRQS